jgi:hypothetical protein
MQTKRPAMGSDCLFLLGGLATWYCAGVLVLILGFRLPVSAVNTWPSVKVGGLWAGVLTALAWVVSVPHAAKRAFQ